MIATLSAKLAAAAALLATLAIAAPTVYLAGDSTMAVGGGGTGTQGWGVYLNQSLSLTVVNDAIAGRSARSYTREGRFTTLGNSVKSGDYVIIEFGHNDGGSLTPTDNGRTDCSPSGTNYAVTCQTTYNGVAETVQTYTTYLSNAAKSYVAKGANVIISTATPNNVCETGTCSYGPNRFVAYAQAAASMSGATFVDHGQTTANAYIALGVSTVDSYYPNDHTHTSPTGAQVVAKAFITGLKTTSSTLKNYVK
ncbi:MAG: Rhamnogalacturonan acetylesterase [Bogoriella megaspora]|nr:MAG: Rhamnogalacturonan acetylesterase [Bogoriella megaspora]